MFLKPAGVQLTVIGSTVMDHTKLEKMNLLFTPALHSVQGWQRVDTAGEIT